MSFNFKTVMTWEGENADLGGTANQSRHSYLRSAVASQLIPTSDPTTMSANTFVRFWATEQAANDWKSFLTDLATQNNANVNVTIEQV